MTIKDKLLRYLTTKPLTAQELSIKLRCHLESIKSALGELVNEGVVEVVKNKADTNGGSQLTNFYRIK